MTCRQVDKINLFCINISRSPTCKQYMTHKRKLKDNMHMATCWCTPHIIDGTGGKQTAWGIPRDSDKLVVICSQNTGRFSNLVTKNLSANKVSIFVWHLETNEQGLLKSLEKRREHAKISESEQQPAVSLKSTCACEKPKESELQKLGGGNTEVSSKGRSSE